MRDPLLARYYDIVHASKIDDVEYYVACAFEEGGPVCELGAGTGRIAVPVARVGVDITAVDLDPSMLERLVVRVGGEGSAVQGRVRWEQGDMRSWGDPARFAQVFIPFRAFMHNVTRQQRHDCLVNCRRILRPGGRLVLNVFHPSQWYMTRFFGPMEGRWEELGSWQMPDDPGGTLYLAQSSRYDTVDKIVSVVFRWREHRSDGSWLVTDELAQPVMAAVRGRDRGDPGGAPEVEDAGE